MADNNKKLFQVIKEEQIIAILLAESQQECEGYLLENNIVDDIEYVKILEVAKKENEEEKKVIPLMVAKKFIWYDLRHYKHLYIYQNN